MEQSAIEKLVEMWQEEVKTLSALPGIEYIQIFESKVTPTSSSPPALYAYTHLV